MTGRLQVLAPGWSTSIQDDGRPGYADLGVSRSGALDQPLRRLLNRLVGNTPDAAVLETLGGLRLRPTSAAVVATSAERAARTVGAGAELVVEAAADELWGYLAVRGGITVEPVLGSRSHDSRSGLGPDPVEQDDELPVGPEPRSPVSGEQAPHTPRRSEVTIRRGPRLELLAAESIAALNEGAWAMSEEVSRVGGRLDGPQLHVLSAAESLASEGLLPGAIQVPPDGRPIIVFADHPTTGGYPVVAVVDRSSLAAVVQCRPGLPLRLRLVE